MKYTYFTISLILAICFASCQKKGNQEATENTSVNNEPDAPVWTLNSDSVELGTPDFYTFDVERDYTELNERVFTHPKKKLYVENNKFAGDIQIEYNGEKATVSGDNAGVKVQTNGAHVVVNATKEVAITLTGKSSNGSLKVEGDKQVRINLKGVDLQNTNGPAISNMSKKLCFLVTDSASVLRDDTLYAQVEVDSLMPKGCLCSKGKMSISGQAPLKIVAKGADAIHSSKSIFVRRGSKIDIESQGGTAIKAKNHVKIEGGMLNINQTAGGAHGIAAKKMVEIAGGRTVIVSNTGAAKAGKNTRCIKSDSVVAITGGIVRLKDSSVGGKGIRAGYKFHCKNCILDVLTLGDDDPARSSKNRGIMGVQEIRIDSSRVRVRSVSGRSEALSSRMKIILNNSLVEVMSTGDDAISSGEVGVADVEINGGRLFADAYNDAIDSNGTIHVSSGLLFTIARYKGGRGFDCDNLEFKIGPEATVVGVSQISSSPTVALLEHPACLVRRPLHDPQFCVSPTGTNENMICFDTPEFKFSDTGFKVLLSLPEMKQNVQYDLCSSGKVTNPKHTFHGLQIGGTLSEKAETTPRSFVKNYTVF